VEGMVLRAMCCRRVEAEREREVSLAMNVVWNPDRKFAIA
jgi:hypothetical protein